MTKMSVDQPFSYALSPVKTLWFEFLLDPSLLQKHLQDQYADPSAIELIILFLNNANPTGNTQSPIGSEDLFSSPSPSLGANVSSNSNTNLASLDAKLDSNSNSSATSNGNAVVNRKALGLKLLALKVAAYLGFSLEIIEQKLPINMQYMLLNELIKLCETSQGNKCSLFAYINYYRWILRAVARLTHPTKKTQNIPVPLLQQIDPCYLPNEIIDNWTRKLKELTQTAVAGLEKVIKENEVEELSNIIMPNYDCLRPLGENADEPAFDWTQIQLLDTQEVMDTIKFELGKWFFLNENYIKANNYFDKISKKFCSLFKQLPDYAESAKCMLSSEPLTNEETTNEQHLTTCLDLIEKGEVCHFYELEQRIDATALEKELSRRLKESSKDKQRHDHIKHFVFYLACKYERFKRFLQKIHATDEPCTIASKTEAVFKFDVNNEESDDDNIELRLLSTVDPGEIIDICTKITKHPLQINHKWELPRIHGVCLAKNAAVASPQYIKCHLVLAKALELRRAKLYSEARTLFLSLFEDLQTSMPTMAEIVNYELLQTDLEHLSEKPTTSITTARRTELASKCEAVLTKEATINEISPQLVFLASLFLLENDIPTLKDYLNSTNAIIKLCACLFAVKNSSVIIAPRLVGSPLAELWELLLSSFSSPGTPVSVGHKRRAQMKFSSVTLAPALLTSFLQKHTSMKYAILLLSAFSKIHNLVRDNQQVEISLPPCPVPLNWPNSIGGCQVELNRVSSFTKILLKKALDVNPSDIQFLRMKSELSLIECRYQDALSCLLNIFILRSAYFTEFSSNAEEEQLIQRMITCSMRLCCFTQAVVLHQMAREINYSLVFKALAEKNCFDSCDDLYECIWDVTILEYLIHLHHKRGELDRKAKIIYLISQLELNANNAEHIRKQAASIRRGRFFRYMSKKYL